MNRPPRRVRRGLRLGAGLVAIALLAVVGVAGDRWLRGRDTGTVDAARAAAASPSAAVSSPVVPPSASPGVSATVTPPANGVNVYAFDGVGNVSAAVAGVPSRVYVPNSESNSVSEIDPATLKIIATFPMPRRPQHVVPSYDMQTLYVTSDLGGALTPMSPVTGKPRPAIPVTDPYNLYFTPDGSRAIVVPEQLSALDFRNPHTWALMRRVPLPCSFPNHLDFTADGSALVASCEGSGQLVRVDVATMAVTGAVSLGRSPQDIRLSADGTVFYVADPDLGGVEVVDATTLAQLAFIATGKGAHGLYPSRDGTELYATNRIEGTVSVISFASRQVVATWQVPGGSPDMGGVSADGTQLWLTGRYNSEVYVIDTTTGALRRIPVAAGPHGLCLFPQPGRISLGHTGNYR